MTPMFKLCWLTLCALLVGGCSGYDGRYAYEPRPADVLTAVGPGTDEAAFHTLISINGVRRLDAEQELPASVELRVRVENTGTSIIHFDPRDMVLTAGNLKRFDPPLVRPEAPSTLHPGEQALVDAWFPFPGNDVPGEYDLSGLNLRWTCTVNGQPHAESVTFKRKVERYHNHHYHPHYYDPHYYPHHRFYFGVGYDH